MEPIKRFGMKNLEIHSMFLFYNGNAKEVWQFYVVVIPTNHV